MPAPLEYSIPTNQHMGTNMNFGEIFHAAFKRIRSCKNRLFAFKRIFSPLGCIYSPLNKYFRQHHLFIRQTPQMDKKKTNHEGSSFYLQDYPIDPSISNLIRRFISTAYSIGSSFVNGSMKPITIISVASSSEIPRLIR